MKPETSCARPSVLATRDPDADLRGRVEVFTRWIAAGTGARILRAPPFAARRAVLDIAAKREVHWLVTGARRRALSRPGTAPLDGGLGGLLRRAPCPVLSVQPWAVARSRRIRTGVVGADRSPEARAAAHAAAALVARAPGPATLVLVHGCAIHPNERAAGTPWRCLVEQMRPERHAWLGELAEDLRRAWGTLRVDVVTRLAWAPDLIGGVAQRADADFTALGVVRRPEGRATALGLIQQRVLRATPCPMLTACAPG